jgi:hypothetical protein
MKAQKRASRGIDIKISIETISYEYISRFVDVANLQLSAGKEAIGRVDVVSLVAS